MAKQYRRQHIALNMTPYGSTEGADDKILGDTLTAIGKTLASAAKGYAQVDSILENKALEEEAKEEGRTGRGGGLSDEAQAQLADAQLSAFNDLQSANNRIREKYRDAPDGDKMNAELNDEYKAIAEKYGADVPSAAMKQFRNSMTSNMKELIRANYSDARSRKAAIAAKKEKELKAQVEEAEQRKVYDAGRNGVPLTEVAATVIPKELQENPNMPVDAATKRQVEAIPALYLSGAIDKPAYDTYDENGALATQGIIPEEKIHAPVNFDKIIDDYYDRVIDDISALPGLSDYQKKKFTEKANYARDNRKLDFARYVGEYKRIATSDFIRDPQSDLMESALFHDVPDGYIESEEQPDEAGVEVGTETNPKMQFEAKPVKIQMERLANNAYKSSTATTPDISAAADVVRKMQIPDALDETEIEQQAETALKNVNDVLENPKTTNAEREAARTIIANALANPETRVQTNELFAKAQILDQYVSLFSPTKIETDKKFQTHETNPHNSGVYWGFESKKAKEFHYDQASEKNKAKYRLVRDTYLGVMDAASKGDTQTASTMIDLLPYNVAKINYGGQISPAMIDQFYEIDKSGEQQVRPSFMFKGYDFEYLGMDKTGTIIARRKL